MACYQVGVGDMDRREMEGGRMIQEKQSPLPWKVRVRDGLDLEIIDANGNLVFVGNVCGGIEWSDPRAPEMLARAIGMLNKEPEAQQMNTEQQIMRERHAEALAMLADAKRKESALRESLGAAIIEVMRLAAEAAATDPRNFDDGIIEE